MLSSREQIDRTFAADAESVGRARQFARETVDAWGAGDVVESVVLVVSELVTNAIVHTGTPATLDIRLDASCVRLAVEDRYPGRPFPVAIEPSSEDAEQGRGLLITSMLATTWGVEYTAASKRVWASIDRAAAMTAEAGPLHIDQTGERARVAVIEVGPDGAVHAWNREAVDMFGWTSAEVVGRQYQDMLDSGDPGLGSHGLAIRSDVSRWQGTYALRGKSGPATVFASHFVTASDGGGVVLVVPEQHRGLIEWPRPEPARSSSADPLGLSDHALARLGLDDYLALVVEQVRDRTGADASYMLLARDFDDEFQVKAVSGLPASVTGRIFERMAAGVPAAHAQFLPVTRYDLAQTQIVLLEGTELQSLVVVPVVIEGRVTGALGIASERPGGFNDDEAVLVQRSADWVASAVDRARLQAAERERRSWLGFLAESGVLLAGSLDQNMTSAMTGQIVVPTIASWCAIHLDDERGQPVLQQVWHQDEGRIEPLRAALEGIQPTQIEATENPTLDGEVTTIVLEAHGRRIGHLTLGRARGNPFRGEIRLVAEAVARRAALAIDNARAHGALRAVGQALQRSLIPEAIPQVPGLQVGVVYEAAGRDAAAGGDFYDLFSIGAGQWCFMVGDVCGTGPEAAAVTGLARHTVRALVKAGLPVGAALERLNAAILEEGARSRFLTMVCGTLAPTSDGRVHLRLVCAGHPLPFLSSGGSITQIGSPQLLLGVFDTVEYVVEELVLQRGDLLVTVTDGVLERRRGTEQLGEEGVVAALAAVGRHPSQTVADSLLRAVVEFDDQPPGDDIAIMAIRVLPGS